MNRIKKYLTVKWCALVSALLGMLGFAACGSKDDDCDLLPPRIGGSSIIENGPCLYGQPYAIFQATGAVFNEDGEAVEGVKVYVRDHYGDTTKTDQDGKFVFYSDDIFPRDYWLMTEDSSGVYEADSVRVITKFEGGGEWYRGSYSTTQDFTLKKKPAEPEEPENPEDAETNPEETETLQDPETPETPSESGK